MKSDEKRVPHADPHAERRRGASVMELAVLLPLLLVLFIGIIDFGRVFYTAMTISHAARAGVQYGAQDNIRSGDFAGMRQAAQGTAGDVAGVTVTACRYCRCADGTGSCTNCTDGSDGCSTGSGCLNACPTGAPQVFVRVTADKECATRSCAAARAGARQPRRTSRPTFRAKPSGYRLPSRRHGTPTISPAAPWR